MPRKPRLYQLERSLVYHIINRGVIRQTIFHGEEDVTQFLSLIKRYQKRFPFKIYHWVLMSNHYHLVMELAQPKDLSKIIGPIQQIYAVYHHRRHRTAGQLFQSRYKSQAIEKGSYLLSCGRYVERNPLRAGLVKLPWDYKASSSRYYVFNEPDGITQPNPEWLGTNGTSDSYRKWLLDDKAKDEEKLFRSDTSVIGSSEFPKKLMSVDGRLYPRTRGRPRE
jgi:putative transposase